MELTTKQQEGLAEALRRYKNNEKYVVISGYAGTGKSTLVKFIIEALDVDPNKVVFCSFTGKATEVLRKKGNKNTMTLHKLLYESIPRRGGGFMRIPKLMLEYTVVVVDECSMVPKSMVDMLMKHKVFTIYLGDPGQLPVIEKKEAHGLLDKPHVFLDEVMRQAAESEIIRLSMKIRNGEDISYSEGKEVVVLPKEKMVTGHLTWADQVVCATNSTRIGLNSQMRALHGFSGALPQDGDKMICLHNYWDDLSDDGSTPLVNGMTGIIKNPFETFRMAPMYVKMKDHKIPLLTGEFISEDGQEFHSVDMDKTLIETGDPFLDWRESYALGKLKNKIGDITPRAFTFGYAITAWKAQGSEWDKVTVIEESFPFDKTEHKQFLYTCVTRASEKLVLLR